MIPLLYETAVIMNKTGTDVEIAGMPATIADSSMRIHPIFDWSPISLAGGAVTLPLWLFITAGFILILLWVILSWVFRIRRMRSVKGYVEAAGKGTQEDMQVWIFGKTKKLTIECLKYWGGMVHYPLGVKITKWRHASIMSTMNIGGVPALAVSDDYDHTRDMVSEIALCVAGDSFNKDQSKLIQLIKEKKVPQTTAVSPITCFSDYKDYGRAVLELLYPEGIWIPSWSMFDAEKFRKYFPRGRDGDLSGGIFLRKSRKLKARTKDIGIISKLLPIGLCVLFVGILVFGAMYVPLGK